MSCLRSLVFYILFVPWTSVFGLLVSLGFFLPQSWLWQIIAIWRSGFTILCSSILGIRCRAVGLENLPKTPSILLSKHQSAWETIALQDYAPYPVFVMKRELFRLPFLGWGLAAVRMIGIDRKTKKDALLQLVEQGRDRLAKGRWIIIFPEGTRVAPGEKKRYQRGGAHLSIRTGTQVIPVAHNAGEYWPRKSFIKKPGLITVSFGPAIDPSGLDETQLNTRVETWIENEMRQISPGSYQ